MLSVLRLTFSQLFLSILLLSHPTSSTSGNTVILKLVPSWSWSLQDLSSVWLCLTPSNATLINSHLGYYSCLLIGLSRWTLDSTVISQHNCQSYLSKTFLSSKYKLELHTLTPPSPCIPNLLPLSSWILSTPPFLSSFLLSFYLFLHSCLFLFLLKPHGNVPLYFVKLQSLLHHSVSSFSALFFLESTYLLTHNTFLIYLINSVSPH